MGASPARYGVTISKTGVPAVSARCFPPSFDSRYTTIMHDIVYVFLGGGLGASCRWLISRLSARVFGAAFPFGTLIVNYAGCFLIGLTLGLVEREVGGRRLKPLAVVGFLGGLTTFSSYAYETIDLLRRGAFGKALANIALDNLGGLALAALGLVAGLALGTRLSAS